MRTLSLPILIAATLAITQPAVAQTDISDILSGVAKSLLAQELEQNAFREAQRQNTVSAYRNYLAQFPNGLQRTSAENALAKLGEPVGPVPRIPPVTQAPNNNFSAASIEASLGLTRTQRTLLQTQLTALGYPTGVADGLWGSNTRSAITSWQKANTLTATGYVTAQQVGLIEQQAGPVAAPVINGPVTADDAVEERLLGLTSEERREVQRRLTRLGYNTKGVDGAFGPNTRRALAAWQDDEGLRATGYVTADQLRELRRQTAI